MAHSPDEYLPLAVLTVSDTVNHRRLLSHAVEGLAGVKEAGTAVSGSIALDKIKRLHPDVVLLDADADGAHVLGIIETLRCDYPDVAAVMAAGASASSAALTVRALESGAFDFVQKPLDPGDAKGSAALRADLGMVLRSFGICRMARLSRELQFKSQTARVAAPGVGSPRAKTEASTFSKAVGRRCVHIEAVVVAASTGGPAALGQLIPALPGDLPVPLLIVQHMPPLFTRLLAEELNGRSSLSVSEGVDDEPVQASQVTIAPGGQHMVLKKSRLVDQEPRIGLDGSPPVNSCRPSADVLFRSAAEVYGGDLLAVVMTGIGPDGRDGVRALKERGGYCIAQDEASSVIYGMPKAVIEAGLADEVLPLSGLVDRIAQLVGGNSPGAGKS
jgi:two-component system chemotaxis response regulator CheB